MHVNFDHRYVYHYNLYMISNAFSFEFNFTAFSLTFLYFFLGGGGPKDIPAPSHIIATLSLFSTWRRKVGTLSTCSRRKLVLLRTSTGWTNVQREPLITSH